MWSESRTGATSTGAEAPSPDRPGPIDQGKKACRIGPGRCGTSENSVKAKFAEFLFQALGCIEEWEASQEPPPSKVRLPLQRHSRGEKV
jgi:hypothetical protein